MIKRLGVALAGLILAACGTSAAVPNYAPGEALATYDFETGGTFEEGAYGDASLRIIDGVYQIEVLTGDNTIWWGQWGENFTDTVIEVDVEQRTDPANNAYGVMCRVRGNVGQRAAVDPTMAALAVDSTDEPTPEATVEGVIVLPPTAELTAEADTEETSEADATVEATLELALEAAVTAEATGETQSPVISNIDAGNGYLFLIQGNGQYGIFRSRQRTLTPLVDWTQSDAINTGAATNRIRAACVGDTLTLTVNDTPLASVTDNTYAGGQVGLAASSADRLGTLIYFDNLTIATAVEG